jgi:hypothetical protein
MRAVDGLFAEYGECAEICAGAGLDKDGFCVPDGAGGWRGVNLTRFLQEGNDYARAHYPKLDVVADVRLVADSDVFKFLS